MKILIVSATYLPSINGITLSLARQKQILEDRGHSITLLVPKHPDQQEEKGVLRLPSLYNPIYPDYPILLPVPTVHNLKILKYNYDLVYFHHPFYVGQLALNLANYFKCPAVFFYHSQYEKSARLYFPKFFPNIIINYLVAKNVHKIASQANQIVVETSSVKQQLINKGISTNISIIPSVGTGMKNKLAKDILKKRYGFKSNDAIILSVSRLSKEKNLLQLLRLFAGLKNIGNTKLLLVGEGPLKKNLLNLAKILKIEDKIYLQGKIDYEKLNEIYSLSDIFVHAGKLETQAIVILEAMSAGLPIVAFNATGPKDFITDQEDGFLANNEKGFIDKLERLVDNRELRLRIGNEALKTSQKYSTKKTIDQLEKLFSGLTKL